MLSASVLVTMCFLVMIHYQVVNSLCFDRKGLDRESCREGNDKCCNSLLFLSNISTKKNLVARILTDITLNGILELTDFDNITIMGNSNKILCNASIYETGIYIKNVSGLSVYNLSIEQCSMLKESSTLQYDSEEYQLVRCGIYIKNCVNMKLQSIAVKNSTGAGMLIYDTVGTIQILESTFQNNGVESEPEYPGGGGLKIEFTPCKFNMSKECQYSTNDTEYIIANTNFSDNTAYEVNPSVSSYLYNSYQGQGRGGGLFFAMRGHSNKNILNLKDCKFIGNIATTWGGGLYLSLRDSTIYNNIFVSNCDFIDNNCLNIGGGGVELNFISYDDISGSNTVFFTECNFIQNRASIVGGGLSFSSSRENGVANIGMLLNNTIHFDNCQWHNNIATLGSAVDISPTIFDVLGNGILPNILFSDCTFSDNHVNKSENSLKEGVVLSSSGKGTMLVSNFVVQFKGVVIFQNNKGNGICLQSGIIDLSQGTKLQLINNTAKFGGAIALYAFSVIYVAENTILELTDNVAEIQGGAIYAKSVDTHERVTSRSCFIQKGSRYVDRYLNTTVIFNNNKATSGNSIYASTFKPCDCGNISISSLECIGKIQGLHGDDITTSYNKFGLADQAKSNLNELVPGQYYKIPIKAYDEFDKPVTIVYDLSLQDENTIELDKNASSVSYISDSTQRFLASKDIEQNTLLLTKDHFTISLNISTIECPPGHILSSTLKICLCEPSKFKGIWRCNRGKKIALIINGFWIGKCGNGKQCTGNCVIGLCNNKLTTELTTRIDDTYLQVCNKNREGKLCGKCTANHSAYYHSDSYRCDEESLCQYGILFYILSEILPLTIIFVIVIAFNISFTTGTVNGIILYAQILDSFVNNVATLTLDKKNEIKFHAIINVLTEIYKAVYEISNLSYFSIEKTSFCLWKGATTLDIIVWKYVTIIYAFVLITVTVLCLNTTRCKRAFTFWRPHNLRSSVINGFSAFLVMCYSQCAKISFQLLTFTVLVGYNFEHYGNAILYSGEQTPFDKVHTRYGVPAIAFMLTIVVLPPLLLILYPSGFKILALCKLSETKLVNRISNIIPVQWFDSFQSCYKDNFRFFAGLYFIYRVIPLLLFAITTDILAFYIWLEVFLVLVLALNAVLQPYKKDYHNKTDSLIFTNLALINGITLFNHQKINASNDTLKNIKKTLTIATSFQLFLIYLPLFYIIIRLVLYVVRCTKTKIKKRRNSKINNDREILLDSTSLPPLRSRLSVYPEDSPFFEVKYNTQVGI